MTDISFDNNNGTLYGTTGDDTLSAQEFTYTSGWFLTGFTNHYDYYDEVWGTQGNDTIYGVSKHVGSTVIKLGGQLGSDYIYGGSADEIIEGGSGSDILSGGLGSDTIYAGLGNDLIFTGPLGYASESHKIYLTQDSEDITTEDKDIIFLGGDANDHTRAKDFSTIENADYSSMTVKFAKFGQAAIGQFGAGIPGVGLAVTGADAVLSVINAIKNLPSDIEPIPSAYSDSFVEVENFEPREDMVIIPISKKGIGSVQYEASSLDSTDGTGSKGLKILDGNDQTIAVLEGNNFDNNTQLWQQLVNNRMTIQNGKVIIGDETGGVTLDIDELSDEAQDFVSEYQSSDTKFVILGAIPGKEIVGDYVDNVGGSFTVTANKLEGTIYADQMYGLSDDDTLTGDNGNDGLSGGEGEDSLDGGQDDDTLIGGAGVDTLIGGYGADTFVFDSTDGTADIVEDFSSYWGDSLSIDGSAFNSTFGVMDLDLDYTYNTGTVEFTLNLVNPVDDTSVEVATLKSRYGSASSLSSSDIIDPVLDKIEFINVADSTVTGTDEAETLAGSFASETLNGGLGSDTLYGGYDADTFVFDAVDGTVDVIEDFNSSEDNISINQGNFFNEFGVTDLGYNHDETNSTLTLYMDNANDATTSPVEIVTVNNITSSEIDSVLERVELTNQVISNSFIGDGGANLFEGTDEENIIQGNAGKDTLIGAGGDDLIEGNAGNDSIEGGAGKDTIYGGAGKDTIYGGAGNDTIQGDGAKDTIYGGAGNDSIEGGAGNDYINGGDGDDTVIGGQGVDTMYGGAGYDILDFADGDQGIRFRMSLPRYAYDAWGNEDYLWGNEDDLDTYYHGFELIKGTSDDDLMMVHNSDSSLHFYDIDLMGEAGNDFLVGSGNDQFLDGGTGADTLRSFSGDDTLTGGTGADVFRYDGRFGYDKYEFEGTDVITDFSAADGDIIQLSAKVYGITDVSGDVTFDAATGELFAGSRTDAIAILEGVSSFDVNTSVELI